MSNLIEIIAGSNIAKDDFNVFVDSCTIIDFFGIEKIENYCREKKEHADMLVLEDEFVGKTYKNLEVLNNVIIKRINK